MAAREEPLLESWKEISAYLKRSVRTCKRWESALGLPIHRLDGTPNARVFAYPSQLDRWLNEKLHHRDNEVQGEKEARAAPVRRSMRGLAIAATVAAVSLIGLATRSFFFRVALVLPDKNPTVAVMPFVNAGGNATLEPWTTALADLIVTDLAQSRVVNAVRVTDLTRALADLKMADPVPLTSDGIEAVAAMVRADHVVTGRFAGTGRSQALILAIHSRGQRSPKEIRVDLANEKEIFRTVDTLTRRMKYALGLARAQVSGDLDRDVRRISTGSPQAFMLFSQGLRFLAIANYQDGVSRLLETVAMDPEFALAYKYLFRGCENSLRADDAKAYALRAAGLADRMSERERGEFLYLFHDRYTGDEVKKRQSLERLCRFYPDDRFGSTLLLGYYADREEWAGGLPLAERAWDANRGDANLTGKLAQFYENTGRADQAERVLGEFIEANPGHRYLPSILDWRSSFFVRSGQAVKALADLDRKDALFPNRPRPRLPRAHIYMHSGDFDAAERELRPAAADGTADPRERIGLLTALAEMDLMRGRPEAALRRLREGLDIAARLPGAGKDRQAVLMTMNIHLHAAYLLRLVGRLPEAGAEIESASDLEAKSRLRGEPPPLEIWHLRALILLDMGEVARVRSAGRRDPAGCRRGREAPAGEGLLSSSRLPRAQEERLRESDRVSQPRRRPGLRAGERPLRPASLVFL